jgi:hypothetical protein
MEKFAGQIIAEAVGKSSQAVVEGLKALVDGSAGVEEVSDPGCKVAGHGAIEKVPDPAPRREDAPEDRPQPLRREGVESSLGQKSEKPGMLDLELIGNSAELGLGDLPERLTHELPGALGVDNLA